ncbi:uncharacterized protein LOC114187234 isoform X2 [Vigna unguiculata]|uniref:uncharacterized protein LOC114187234 isoform X2 n=1 Tax=Vigna unguiculata TaxID=3917 RepID=UPI0010166D8D|nr:uncharacterized protein LOC114187234 isoform X2 [Vigna unguiculata]
MVEQRIMSVVPSSSNSCTKKYDVFISYRGKDTRKNFSSHLYEALMQKKVETYIDEDIEKGDEISAALMKAIEDSRVSIVVFSENFASSKWCLNELIKIMDCKKELGQIVIPVFYSTDPSHVRNQTGRFMESFVKHEGEPNCIKWKTALTQAANLAGWSSQNYRTDAELLKDIVGDVLKRLPPRCRNQYTMECVYDSVASITAEKKTWRIQVKIIRMWTIPGLPNSRQPFSVEMVLMDDKGCKIHASMRRALIYKFISMLKEGNIYCMGFFTVGSNDGDYRTTKHDFKLNFEINTVVEELKEPSITHSPYSFVPFNDMLEKEYDMSYLVDVIGLVTGVVSKREYIRQERKIRMIVIEIESGGLKMDCALFGNYVDELNSFLGSGEVASPVVIQFARVKTFRGKVSLQSMMHGTKLLFRENVPESIKLMQRITQNSEAVSTMLSQPNASPKYNMEQDFLFLTPRKTIEELKDLKEDCFCITLATIKDIEESDNWWYTACKCNKSVFPDSNMYFCANCNLHVVTTFPRYRIKLRVSDDTDSASFVVFDHEVSSLLKIKCADMIKKHNKAINATSVPREIKDLIGKILLFKVEIKKLNNSQFQSSYAVKRISDDELIIEKFLKLSALKIEFDVPLVNANKFKFCSTLTSPSKNLLQDFTCVSADKDCTEEITHSKRKRHDSFDLAMESRNNKILKTLKDTE